MKTIAISLFTATLVAAPLAAGVVFEIETTDHSASPPRQEEGEISVEGRNIAMDIAPNEGERGSRGRMVFRGDRR